LLATITLGCPDCKTTYDDNTATNTAITYLYKVTATNAIGEGTNCGEFPIVANVVDKCNLPGSPAILTDQAGDIITPTGVTSNPGWDLRSLSIAEPFAFAPDKLVFTLKVESFAAGLPPEGTRWPVQFLVNGGTTTGYWVDMSTVAPATPTAPVFRYGTFNPTGGTGGVYGAPSTVVGTADAASTFNADGTITIVVARSAVGNPAVGGTLSGFLVRVRAEIPVVGAITPDNMPDSLIPAGSYTIIGNQACAPNTCPVASLSASPTSGNAPLTVDFDGTGSNDPDVGDTIASYTFNFGDGSPAVTCPGSGSCTGTGTTSHIYGSPGDYLATLSVTDSHGLVSCNTASEVISVGQAGTMTNYALTSSGAVAVASSSYPGGGYPAASAINGDRNGANWGFGTGGWADGTRGLYPDSLEVDFSGAAKAISEIRVYTLQNNWKNNPGEPTANTSCSGEGILDFQVQYWNGTAWVTVTGGSVTGNDKAMRIFTFPAVTTSKIQVVITAARNNYSRIVELEAYGTPGQP
jgi:PKD repeat protein